MGIAGDKPLYFGKGASSTPRLDAARLLYQGTFGPTEADIASVQSLGAAAWIDGQFAQPKSTFTPMPWWPTSRPSTSTNPLCPFPNYLTASYTPGAPCNCSDSTGFNRCQRDVYTNYRLQNEFLTKALTAPGPAAPANRLGAVTDHRDVEHAGSPRVPDARLLPVARGQCLRQLPGPAAVRDRQPLDGQLPRHGQQQRLAGAIGGRTAAERELRPGAAAALQHRPVGTQG